MIRLPNPDKYEDPIRYFRDSHGVVGNVLDRFEKLLNQVKQGEVSGSFATNLEWSELLHFFVNIAPRHEREEELALFPIVLEKIPHLGFHMTGSPGRFIHDQHEAMQVRARILLEIWKATMAEQKLSDENEQTFFSAGRELIKLYREHVAMENKIIYTFANDTLLTPIERIAVMLLIRESHSDKTTMPVLAFDDSPYESAEIGDLSDAVSDGQLDALDDEDDPDEDE